MVLALSETAVGVLLGVGGAILGVVIGIIGGAVGQWVQFRLNRRGRREEQQLTDLLKLQDELATLNRRWHIISRYWREGTDVPYEEWDAFVGARAIVLALNERVVDETLRRQVQDLRLSYGVEWNRPFVQGMSEKVHERYDAVQASIGAEVRRRLG